MSTATNNATTGTWDIEQTAITVSSSGTSTGKSITISTGGKYVDKDIVVKAPTATVASTSAKSKTNPVASATGTNVTLTKVSSKPSSGYYITASATKGVTNVASAGWISAGDTSTSAATDVYYTVSSASITGSVTVTGATTYTSQTEGKTYVTCAGTGSSTAGYVYNGSASTDNKYIEIFDGTYTLA